LRCAWRAPGPGRMVMFAFFLGEGIKVLLSVALFGLIAAVYPDADWLALLTTFIAVLQVYVFGFLLTSR
jgi:F0F1-type ATP synthase assembly protein I